MSLVIDIADAVAAELNAAPPDTFSQAFAAARMVLPEFDLEDLAELKVTVVPKAVEITGATRSGSQPGTGPDFVSPHDGSMTDTGTCPDGMCELFSHKLANAKEAFERQYLVHNLKKNGYNIVRTAEAIGVYASNLHTKIRKYGIEVGE